MSNFRHCIVTAIDLVGIKDLTKKKGSDHTEATRRMRTMHSFANSEMARDLKHHSRAYVWNDSIMLLAYVDPFRPTDYARAMKEADRIKSILDKKLVEERKAKATYAVAVEGMAFPNSGTEQPRVVFVETTGYAMANCFEIPKKFCASEEHPRKKDRRECPYKWYVDRRIYKKIKAVTGISEWQKKKKIEVLPYYKSPRTFFAYRDYLWTKNAFH